MAKSTTLSLSLARFHLSLLPFSPNLAIVCGTAVRKRLYRQHTFTSCHPFVSWTTLLSHNRYLSYTNDSENEKTHLQRKCAESIFVNEGGRLIIGFATAMSVFLRGTNVTD